MGSIHYGVHEVSISQAIDIVIDEPSLMPSGYYFVSHDIDQRPAFFPGFEKSYDQVSIDIIIHRRPTYLMRLIYWPGMILMILTLGIFFIPPSASERILYGNEYLIVIYKS